MTKTVKSHETNLGVLNEIIYMNRIEKLLSYKPIPCENPTKSYLRECCIYWPAPRTEAAQEIGVGLWCVVRGNTWPLSFCFLFGLTFCDLTTEYSSTKACILCLFLVYFLRYIYFFYSYLANDARH